jgi:hypothetical protein
MRTLPARPCYYDSGIQCEDCNGTRAECLRLIAQDQEDDDTELP